MSKSASRHEQQTLHSEGFVLAAPRSRYPGNSWKEEKNECTAKPRYYEPGRRSAGVVAHFDTSCIDLAAGPSKDRPTLPPEYQEQSPANEGMKELGTSDQQEQNGEDARHKAAITLAGAWHENLKNPVLELVSPSRHRPSP